MADDNPVTLSVRPEVLGEAISALTDCADDLEAELRDRYPEETREQYPSEARRWRRDMEPVVRARQCVVKLNRTPGLNWAGED